MRRTVWSCDLTGFRCWVPHSRRHAVAACIYMHAYLAERDSCNSSYGMVETYGYQFDASDDLWVGIKGLMGWHCTLETPPLRGWSTTCLCCVGVHVCIHYTAYVAIMYTDVVCNVYRRSLCIYSHPAYAAACLYTLYSICLCNVYRRSLYIQYVYRLRLYTWSVYTAIQRMLLYI